MLFIFLLECDWAQFTRCLESSSLPCGTCLGQHLQNPYIDWLPAELPTRVLGDPKVGILMFCGELLTGATPRHHWLPDNQVRSSCD